MKTKLIITEKQYKKIKETLLKEEMFSWDGKYEDEKEVDENCGCNLNQSDVDISTWFSEEEGERLTDKQFN